MTNENYKLNPSELRRIGEYCDRYLYLKEKASTLYERLTLCGYTLGQISGSSFHGKERILAVYAQANEQLQAESKRLSSCKVKLWRLIARDDLLSEPEKQTLYLRLAQGMTIREIALLCQRSDAAIVKRLKKCGEKLCGESENFYNCLSRLQQVTTEGVRSYEQK